jgi:predicted DCC family thiol-disulfide oxidoreductase YuxK
VTKITDHTPIIVLFDGVCNLCNSTVRFIIKHDAGNKFRFASLQSPAGHELLKKFGKDPDSLHSVLVIKDGQLFERSDAALTIAAALDGAWSRLRVLRFVPRFIRDFAYNVVARSRYTVFGKQNECMIPTPELKSRFL